MTQSRRRAMTTIDTTDCYLVLACPMLANGTTSWDLHILEKCSIWNENKQYMGDLITACYDAPDVMDYLAPVPGKIGERVVRPDWVRMVRENTIPNQSERARENMPVYVEWARKEQWNIWASER